MLHEPCDANGKSVAFVVAFVREVAYVGFEGFCDLRLAGCTAAGDQLFYRGGRKLCELETLSVSKQINDADDFKLAALCKGGTGNISALTDTVAFIMRSRGEHKCFCGLIDLLKDSSMGFVFAGFVVYVVLLDMRDVEDVIFTGDILSAKTRSALRLIKREQGEMFG